MSVEDLKNEINTLWDEMKALEVQIDELPHLITIELSLNSSSGRISQEYLDQWEDAKNTYTTTLNDLVKQKNVKKEEHEKKCLELRNLMFDAERVKYKDEVEEIVEK